MRELLHSKRFKKNLSKWLCMYVGVMLLLTTVITYSKYISSFMGDDEARTAKFKIRINSAGCILDSANESCDSGSYFRDDTITYSFNVDTTDLETNAEFFLTVIANNNFIIEKIAKVDGIGEEENSTTICEKDACNDNVNSNGTVFSLPKDDIIVKSKTISSYKVTVKYKETDDVDKEMNYTSVPISQIVTLNYSAIQKN